jgi:hypothetical protein
MPIVVLVCLLPAHSLRTSAPGPGHKTAFHSCRFVARGRLAPTRPWSSAFRGSVALLDPRAEAGRDRLQPARGIFALDEDSMRPAHSRSFCTCGTKYQNRCEARRSRSYQPRAAPRPNRFHGSITLDPTRVGRDAGRIADEVISHLSGLVNSNVTVTLEIHADVPGGVPEKVVRTVTENCRTCASVNGEIVVLSNDAPFARAFLQGVFLRVSTFIPYTQ